jgi:hypothetical protein
VKYGWKRRRRREGADERTRADLHLLKHYLTIDKLKACNGRYDDVK